jgi:hypothetical protein
LWSCPQGIAILLELALDFVDGDFILITDS